MKDLGIGTHNVPTGRARSSFAILLVILTIIGGLFCSATNATAADTVSLVVKLVDGLTPADQAAVIARNGGVETSSVPALRLHVVSVPTADQPLVQQNYQADAQVVSVEVNKTRKAEAIPTDANYGVQWALSKIGWESVFGTVAPTGTATLALLDTGIDATHPDLAGKVIPGTSILDGSNGLSDPSGHGTWLAGIAAAATDNGTGIAGVAFGGVQVMPVSVLNASGIGQDSDIIAGIVWAVDHGADVILMGFSNPDFSQNLQDAIDYAWSKGAVLVAATGNDGVITPTFPAGDRGVIGVSATDQNDLLAAVSNYGQDTFLAAPGTDIYTTGPNGGYSYISGTSASSAFVAGAAAFMKAVDPTLTNGIIVGRLARSADAIGTAGDPNNPTMFGNGRLNMANALADTGIDPVQPAGTPGGGGPFVGPYTAAATVNTTTTVTRTSGTSPSSYGSSLQFTATVTKQGAGSAITVGSVEFRDGGTDCTTGTILQTATTVNASSGVVTYTASNLALGDHTIRACYLGIVSASDTYRSSNGSISQAVANKADQIISVDQAAPSTATYNATFDVKAHASSGLGVAVTTSGSCSGSGTSNGNPGSAVTITMASGTGTCTVQYNQVGDSNYNAAVQVTISTTAQKAATTVSLSNLTQTFTGSALYPTATTTPAGLTVVWTGAPQTNAGSYPVTATVNDTNYQGSASGTFVIQKATPTIAWANPADITYGTALSVTQLNATPSVPGTFAYTPAAGTVLGAGNAQTLHVDFTPNDTANYNITSKDVSINVLKANATCSISGYTGAYDGNAHGATGSCTGVGSATLTDLDLGATFTNVPGGTAHWVFTGNENYKDQSGDVAIVINKADATCSISGYTGTYDATSHGAAGSCIGIGGENAGTLNLGASYKDVAGGNAHWVFTGNGNYNDRSGDVAIVISKADPDCSTIKGYTGTYDAASHGASGACSGIGGENAGTLNLGDTFKNVAGGTAHWVFTGNGNYKDQSGDVAIVINKADATCSISGYTGTYDATSHGASGSCSGIGSENAGTLNLGDTFKNVAGGTAHWVFTGNGNYNNQSGDVAIVINKADADCSSIKGYTGTYDAASHGATGSCIGVGTDGALSGLNLGETFKNVTGGTAHWVFTGNGNYNDQSGDVAIVINKADADCSSIKGYTGTYDAASHGATGSCSGIGSENAGTLNLGASYKDVAGGTAHWVFTGNGNYNDQSGDVAITINKADPDCSSIKGYTGTYDAASHGASGSCSGIGSENAGTLNLGASYKDVAGGTAHWVFTGNGNYNDKSGDVAITISKANATCSISGYTGTYDAVSHGASGSCSGIGGENAGTLNLGASYKDVAGGTAHWVFSGNGNYNDKSGDVAITINKALLTVTADNKQIIFGQSLPTFTFQYSGFATGENASVIDNAPTCKVDPILKYGSYPIVCSGGLDNNYNFNYVNGTLTVDAWLLNGFYQPVDMGNNVLNTVKNGSTVPLKFEVFAGNTELTNVSSTVQSVNYGEVVCSSFSTEDAIEEIATTGGTVLRYDTTGGQFIDNWKTPSTAGKCYRVTMKTLDGSSLSAYFKLK